MGKLDTIETIAAKVSDTSIATAPKRCSYIRNWNSKCKQCLNVCQHEAIGRFGRASQNRPERLHQLWSVRGSLPDEHLQHDGAEHERACAAGAHLGAAQRRHRGVLLHASRGDEAHQHRKRRRAPLPQLPRRVPGDGVVRDGHPYGAHPPYRLHRVQRPTARSLMRTRCWKSTRNLVRLWKIPGIARRARLRADAAQAGDERAQGQLDHI